MKKKNEAEEEVRLTQDKDAVAEYHGEKSNRAKVVEYEGDDYVDKEVKDNSFKGRLTNFWYHYKWHTVISAIVIVVLAVGITQLAGRESYDVSAMYTGPAVVAGDNYDGVERALSAVLKKDIDGDGTKNVYLFAINYMNDSQIADKQALGKEMGIDDVAIDKQGNTQAYKDYSNLLFTGEAGVMMLDRALFEDARDSGGLVTLADALGEKPSYAVDDYGIRLGDTDFYKYFEEMHIIPEDTILCLRGVSTVGGVFTSKNDAEKTYENCKILFESICSFEAME